MIPTDTVAASITGEMTASKIAERLGALPSPLGPCPAAGVLPQLEELREQGRVVRRVTATEDGDRPVVRWRLVG